MMVLHAGLFKNMRTPTALHRRMFKMLNNHRMIALHRKEREKYELKLYLRAAMVTTKNIEEAEEEAKAALAAVKALRAARAIRVARRAFRENGRVRRGGVRL